MPVQSRISTRLMALALVVGLAAPLALAQEAKKTVDEVKGGLAQQVNTAPPGTPAAPKIVQTQPAAALPEALKLSATAHNFGDIPDTDPVEHTFEFTNISDKEITLAVAASCGCTVPTMEKTTYKPGESGKVTARFDPKNRTGPQTKTLTYTITNPQGVFAQQIATLTSNVRALVMYDPQKMFLNEVDHVDGQTTTLMVNGRKDDFKVTKATSSSEFVKITVGEAKKTEVNGEQLTQVPLELSVGKGAPIGNLQAQLEITTNDDRVKPAQYFVGADVVGDVKPSPAQAILRVNDPATAFTTNIRIDARSGTAFNILSVEVDARKDMRAVADVQKENEGKAYTITLSGVTPAEPGMVQGFLIIATDARGGETLRVPFTAVVRRPATGVPVPTAPVAPVAPSQIPPQRIDPSLKK